MCVDVWCSGVFVRVAALLYYCEGVRSGVFACVGTVGSYRVALRSVPSFFCSNPCVGHHYIEGEGGIAYIPEVLAVEEEGIDSPKAVRFVRLQVR